MASVGAWRPPDVRPWSCTAVPPSWHSELTPALRHLHRVPLGQGCRVGKAVYARSVYVQMELFPDVNL